MDEAELNQREQALQQREHALAARVVRMELAEQLRAAGCKADAIADASALMATAGQIELAEDGMSIAKVALGGGEATGVAAAARAFLKARPHFQSPPEDDKQKQAPKGDFAAAFSTTRGTPPPKPDALEFDEHADPGDMMRAAWARPIK